MGIVELASREDFDDWLPKKGIGCEMGVHAGWHAFSLCLRTQVEELHLVDFWSFHPTQDREAWKGYKQETMDRFRLEIEQKKVIIYDDYVENVMPTFADEYFDWIYIDTWHDYQSVKRDIELAAPKVKEGGILCGHDFRVEPSEGIPGSGFVYGWGTGLIRAVIEFSQCDNNEFVALSNMPYADWAIRVSRYSS